MRAWHIGTFTAGIVGLCLAVGLSAQSGWQAPAGKDFPLAGGNVANTRYSSLTRIDKSNIKQLGAAWMTHIEPGKPNLWMQATPAVVDGVMYMAQGHITARDAKTGALKWQYPKGDIGRGGGATGGPDNHFNRGVVVAEGKVFSAAFGTTLLALDQRNGELLWQAELKTSPGGGPSFANAAAMYYDGLVYMGVAGGEQGVRGQFGAYDAKTGREVWKFFTVPGPGEFGHDTWEGESWRTGGAPVWTHPAIDPELGLIYITTGNPWPDTDGTKRGGDNLFSASIVALDLKTGVRKWHYQQVHHDLWDYDGPASPVLADVTYQGRARKILMHGSKTGMMYILDRTNGQPLIGIDEKPVTQEPAQKTSKTQPFPVGDAFVPLCPEGIPAWYPQGCVFTPFYDNRVATAPGTNGGLAWAPMSYSPQTRLLYLCASHRANSFDINTFDGFPFRTRFAGTLNAIDPTTNTLVWQKHLPFQCGGGSGVLSTASGLLFRGQADGQLVAHDATTGDVLWSFQTGAGADAPVVTYEIDGEQYVAILAGGNQYMNSQPGDNLWAFTLGGTVPPLPAPRFPGPPALPPIVRIAPEILPRYVGTYELPLGGPRQAPLVMTVTLEGGVLKMQFADTPKVDMQPTSDTSFITAGPVTSQIMFAPDPQGVIQMTVQGQGPLMRAMRK